MGMKKGCHKILVPTRRPLGEISQYSKGSAVIQFLREADVRIERRKDNFSRSRVVHDGLHNSVDEEVHLEGVMTLSRPVDVLHVPLQLDVEAQVDVQRHQDEL
jgi:hypothetical protein